MIELSTYKMSSFHEYGVTMERLPKSISCTSFIRLIVYSITFLDWVLLVARPN